MVRSFHITLLLIVIVACLSVEAGRPKRSLGDFIKRIFGRRKTGFQGTANAQQPYSVQGSSYYPSYYSNFYNRYAGLNGYNGGGGGGGVSSGSQYQSSGPSYQPYGSYAQASGSYPNYAVSPYASAAANGGGVGGVDFYSVLDHLVRSAGLSPTGDGQDMMTSASNVHSSKDTSPVFSFKKLYSFPFYLNTENAAPDGGYSLQIPFMKRHIRRMAQDYVKRRHLKKLAKRNNQYKKQQVYLNPQQLANHYLVQQLAQQQQDQLNAHYAADIISRRGPGLSSPKMPSKVNNKSPVIVKNDDPIVSKYYSQPIETPKKKASESAVVKAVTSMDSSSKMLSDKSSKAINVQSSYSAA